MTWWSRSKNFGLNGRSAVLLILISLLAATTEIFGVGIFLPIFQYIRMEGDMSSLAAEGGIWGYVINFFNEVHIELTLGSLLLLAFFFFLSRQVFMYLQLVYRASVTQGLNKKKRDELFQSYLEARTDYHDELMVGGLVNVMTTEVKAAVNSIMAP